MKRIFIASLFLFLSFSAMGQTNASIVSPFNKLDIWLMTWEDCPFNKDLGVIKFKGAYVGCWGTDNKPPNDPNKVITLYIDGDVYRFTLGQINYDIDIYNASKAIPPERLIEINNSYRPMQPQPTTPSTTIYTDGMGRYIGSTTNF